MSVSDITFEKSPNAYSDKRPRESYTNKRPRDNNKRFPASVRHSDKKTTINCLYCGSQNTSIMDLTTYNKQQKCCISKNDVVIANSTKDVKSILPVLTLMCNGCEDQFELRLYEDKGGVVLDRV